MILAEDAGFNGDSIEAEAWAYLAVRSLKGLPLTFPTTTGCREAVSGGALVGTRSSSRSRCHEDCAISWKPREIVSAFPSEVRRKVGFQIEKVQLGLDPDDGSRCPASGAA